MAATDLVYNTDNPVLFTPDYSFLRYSLDKKQARYDQGLDAVSKAYNNLKRELTDPVNKDRRDQYLKDAQSQLQKIASSDLSLSENVYAANNVFEPLATNQAFLIDAYHTKRIKNELEIMDEWSKSTDPEIRKQFSPEIQQWVARDLEALRNGKGDINNYKNIKNRSALAYIDPQDLLNKAAKDYGFEYKISSTGDPYIVTTEGGKGGAQNYNAFAQTVLGGNPLYQRQLQVLSENDKESILDAYKRNPNYAGKTDSEIYQEAGLASYDKHRNSAKSFISDLQTNLNKEEASIQAFVNANRSALEKGRADISSGNNNTPDAQMFTQLSQRYNDKLSLKNRIDSEQINFNSSFGDGSATDENRINYAQKFASNPQSFYADQRYKNDIQRFSDIRSASVNQTIKEDTAYIAALNARTNNLKALGNMENQITDNAMDVAKLAEKQREFDLKLALKGQKTVTNADGTTTTVGGKESEISAQSASNYQLYTINSINQLKDKIELNKSKAVNNMTGSLGALSLLNSYGLDNQSTGIIKAAVEKQIKSGNFSKSIGLTNAELDAFEKAFHKVQATAATAGIKIDDSESIKFNPRTIADYLQRSLPGFKISNQNEMKYKTSMDEYFRNIDEIAQTTSSYNKGKEAVIAKFSDTIKHPEFAGMFVKRKDNDGKDIYDIIGNEDVKKQINDAFKGNLTVTEDQKKKIVNSYLDGTLKYNVRANIQGNTGGVGIPAQGPSITETLTLGDGTVVTRYVPSGGNNIFSNIPFPEKYKELIKKINTEIPVPSWMDQQGMMLANPRYVVTGGIAEDIRRDINEGSQSNSNIFTYAGGTAEPEQLDVKKQPDVRNAMKDKDNIAQIDVFTGSPVNNGKLAVAVTFKNKHADGSKGKEDWEGQQYFFPISINQTTPEILQRFAQVDDAGDFKHYRDRGEDYKLNAFEADGIKAIIHPNKPGDTEGFIEILYKPWNEQLKKYDDNFVQMDPMNGFPAYSENAVTINEIKDLIYQKKIYPYITEVLSRRAQESKNFNQINSSLPTVDSFIK